MAIATNNTRTPRHTRLPRSLERGTPPSTSLVLTPPHSSSLHLTPPHSSSRLLTPPHSSSRLLTPTHASPPPPHTPPRSSCAHFRYVQWRSLPKDLVTRVRRYYEHYYDRTAVFDESDILTGLNPNLRVEVLRGVYTPLTSPHFNTSRPRHLTTSPPHHLTTSPPPDLLKCAHTSPYKFPVPHPSRP